MLLSKQCFLRKSDIFILRYNGKSLFRCCGYSTTNGYRKLGGLLNGGYLPQHPQVCLYVGEAFQFCHFSLGEINGDLRPWMIR